MAAAALILSGLSLIVSLSCLVWMLAKHFSTHAVQFVSADNYAPLAKPMGTDLKEIGDPELEENIFERI